MSEEPKPDLDTDDLASLAIASVLGQIPATPGEELTDAQRQQPWAEKIAPQSTTGKRSLEALLDEYREKIAQAPDATVHFPTTPSPAEAALQRYAQGQVSGPRRSRNRGRRRGGGQPQGGQGQRQPQQTAQTPSVQPTGTGQPGRHRRRRRRRGPRPQSDSPAT